MSDSHLHLNDSLLDRLIEAVASGHATAGTSPERDVLEHFTAAEIEEFEAAAAAVACACVAHDAEELPADVRLRCSGAGRAVAAQAAIVHGPSHQRPPLRFTTPSQSGRRRQTAPLGWIAAAACLAIALVASWPRPAAAPPTPEQRMTALVQAAPDLTRWDWEPWNDSYAGVTGEVVWSEAAQEGYLRLAGMPVNDPLAEQYQLWVVESSRGTPLQVPPVDGGVFNVSLAGEIVIPIRCAIPAEGVVAFAITVEQPGGVVVSDQSRKTVIAQAPSQG